MPRTRCAARKGCDGSTSGSPAAGFAAGTGDADTALGGFFAEPRFACGSAGFSTVSTIGAAAGAGLTSTDFLGFAGVAAGAEADSAADSGAAIGCGFRAGETIER